MTQPSRILNDDADHAGDSATDRQRYDYDVAFNDWLEHNPIRQRRTKIMVWTQHGRKKVLSQSGLANRLEPQEGHRRGRAPLTIQNWEAGAVTPKPEGFAALAKFFDDPNIEEEWHNWYRQKPSSPMPQIIQEEMTSEDVDD